MFDKYFSAAKAAGANVTDKVTAAKSALSDPSKLLSGVDLGNLNLDSLFGGGDDSGLGDILGKIDGIIKTNRQMITSDSQADITKGFSYNKDSLVGYDKDLNGYTFFGRPRLNLTTSNLQSSRMLSYLNTTNPNSVGFAIRCLLDPTLADSAAFSENASLSPLFNPNNPFIPILTNRLKNISGWPDPVLETETTEGGYYSEDLSRVIGWDNLSKSYDLVCTFSDVRGGFILALFLGWFIWMDLAVKGAVLPYKNYIKQRRICYTIPIYRFLMDESNTYITKWAKATGSIPISIPLGAYFNYDVSNPYVYEGNNLTIPFKVAGKIEYMDPIILVEFNMLMKRYWSDIGNLDKTVVYTKEQIAEKGTTALPYVHLTSGYNELLWMGVKPTSVLKQVSQIADAAKNSEFAAKASASAAGAANSAKSMMDSAKDKLASAYDSASKKVADAKAKLATTTPPPGPPVA